MSETTGLWMRRERERRGWSRATLARQMRRLDASAPATESLASMIKAWETGRSGISDGYRVLAEQVFGEPVPARGRSDELEALELGRRAASSDVGGATIAALGEAFNGMAIAYQSTSPAVLLERVRDHLAYVAQLMEARATLAERRELLAVGGWMSLLAATCHVDLGNGGAADARRVVAGQLADQAGHAELAAWCLETEAWQRLTAGDYAAAAELARGAQAAAPAGSSALVQATAQEGRALARLGDRTATWAAIERVNDLADALGVPDQAEHHFQYDPGKALSYTATTLAWVGDPEAVGAARVVLAAMIDPSTGPVRRRRVTSARLDLALALVAAGEHDEAHDQTLTALTSGVLVPSNYWRATEVITALRSLRAPAVGELTEAYRALPAAP